MIIRGFFFTNFLATLYLKDLAAGRDAEAQRKNIE
jgi:hypothetical protein